MHHSEVLALELLAAPGAVLDLFSISLARVLIVEEHPLVSPAHPPEFPPNICPLLARATQQCHKLTSFPDRLLAKKLELGASEPKLLYSLLLLQCHAVRAQRVCTDVGALQNSARHQHYAQQGVGAVLQHELHGVPFAQEQAMQPYLPSLFAAPSFEGMIELAARLSICGMLIGCFLEHDVPTLALAVALTDLRCDHAPASSQGSRVVSCRLRHNLDTSIGTWLYAIRHISVHFGAIFLAEARGTLGVRRQRV